MEIPRTHRADTARTACTGRASVESHTAHTAPAREATSGQLAWFCYQFGLALKAGLPAVEAISLIAEGDRRFGEILSHIAEDIDEGMRLHQAMGKQNIFPPYLVNMVKIGEATGALDKVMESLAAYYEREHNLRNAIKDALTYPLILICMVSVVVLVLTSKILPIFNDILISIGAEMPGITRVLMRAGFFIGNNLLWLTGAFLALILAAVAWNLTPEGKKKLARLKVESGISGRIFQKIYAARVAAVMSHVLESGLSMDNALEMSAEVVGNEYMAERIKFCRQKIQEEMALAKCFDLAGVFPREFVNMIRVGHKTGNLPSMARKMAGTYEEEVDKSLQGIVSTIEPSLVVILSVVIGIVLITVMLPLMQIMSSMG
ncbi:MAG TPA: type II secretion system F family protein [Firmicutes bacterium]|nr:type II secretion system F family protein [Bacillota bacterium]